MRRTARIACLVPRLKAREKRSDRRKKTLQNHFTSFVVYTAFLSEDDGTSAAEEAPVVPAKTAPCSEGVAACEDAPATTAETPLAAYRFMDERVWGWTLVLGSLALFFFALYHGTGIMSGSILCFIMGIIRLVQTQQRLGRHACILYRDHLECVSGAWTSDLVSIPYASICEARYSSSKLRLLLASGDGTTRFNVYFYVLEGDKRDEARAVLRDKMRELGVLRED